MYGRAVGAGCLGTRSFTAQDGFEIYHFSLEDSSSFIPFILLQCIRRHSRQNKCSGEQSRQGSKWQGRGAGLVDNKCSMRVWPTRRFKEVFRERALPEPKGWEPEWGRGWGRREDRGDVGTRLS